MTDTNRRTLVLDDDEFVRGLLIRQLGTLGIADVESAADGRAALSEIERRGKFALVICDLLLPGMDGVEFLRHLADRCPGAAVILVTAQEPRVLRTAEAVAGARGLRLLGAVRKPVSTAQLGALLAHLSEPPPSQAAPAAPVSVEALRDAIASSVIDVFVQPKLRTADRGLAGAEALARWPLPGGDRVPPNRFVPLAEENGLIDELTYRVLRRSLEACAQWAREGVVTRISVNLSALSLGNPDLPDIVRDLAGGYGVPLDRVVLEITESRIPGDETQFLETLTRLRLRGIALSIDDFGTGYSSFRQLQRLPFSELKVDGGFVGRMLDDADSSRIVESSVKLARDLGLTSVAECVESESQFARLRELGCDEVQGYLLARPMPADELPAWHRAASGA